MILKPDNIETAAYAVACRFQQNSIDRGKGPLEAFSDLRIELPYQFPNDWRACDFMSLVDSDKEDKDE